MKSRGGRGSLRRWLTAGGTAVVAFFGLPLPCCGVPTPQFERELDTILVIDGWGPVERAWYGGWEKARPQFVDIDADGDADLFVNEEDGKLRFYRNTGTPAAAAYSLVTDEYSGVHRYFWSRFVDMDADGDADLLVEDRPPDGSSSLGFLLHNTGPAESPSFENLSDHPDGHWTDDAGVPIPFFLATPGFADIDRDGDMDLLMGDGSNQGSVILYRNEGGPGSAVMHRETDSYQDISIVFGSCNPERGASPAQTPPGGRHGFMLFSFEDLTADGNPDLFVGDQFNPNVYFWEGTGGPPDPGFTCRTEAYFTDEFGQPAVYAQYILSSFADLDADGDLDAVLGAGTGHDGLVYYANFGTPSFPFHRLESDDWLGEFDRGQNTCPAAADLDLDGDPDLLLGVGTGQRVEYYSNEGSADSPLYAVINPSWISLPGSDWAAPEVADLDGDGDMDVFVGTSEGGIRYWRNTRNGPGEPLLAEVTDHPDFGDAMGCLFADALDAAAVPRFVDLDADGDLDVLVGSWSFSEETAHLASFRNVGSSTAPSFELWSTDFHQLGPLGQSAAPAVADLDADGDPDILVGSRDGGILFFANEGTSAHPAFAPAGMELSGLDVGARSVPTLADLDADGDLDLVVGESGGGWNLFRNSMPEDAPPAAFALDTPSNGTSAGVREPVHFAWESSIDPDDLTEAVYDLRLAASPDAPISEWALVEGLTDSRVTLVPSRDGPAGAEEIWWTVCARSGERNAPVPQWRRLVIDSVPVLPDSISVGFQLESPRPSPFAASTVIRFETADRQRVRLTVLDAAGRRVAVLVDGLRGSGPHKIVWDGRTSGGGTVAPGVYLLRLEAGGKTTTRRVVRVR
ncbi:MAG: FG-GAP-like repeat-containing protein [Gemmatimonadota bacterium]|nr:FG-GAP-like repeat-containing protein [Gemmatimonadota bacterium]MDP6802250.1 FG-GAP-like repeat-containing protein [Gemmatimonadota bacterium]